MADAHVAQVRSCNRTVTQWVGALEEAYLARGRPLGQARLLWEIGPDGHAEVPAFNDEPFADRWFEKSLLPSPRSSRRLPG